MACRTRDRATARDGAGLLDRIVADGACIGCGLCAAVSDGAAEMTPTGQDRERPVTLRPLSEPAAAAVRAACPGLVAEGISEREAGADAIEDPVWGRWRRARIAWAGDPEIRHRASSGGVLSALAAHLITTGEVDFVLHLGPDPDRPARSRWKISRIPEDAADTGGSRYGPAAPLAGLAAAERLVAAGAERFAFIGKPCDVSAIRLLAAHRPWLGAALAYRLTLMCGGASEFAKTAALLDDWGIAERDLVQLRYRGNGNPGPTVARTRDGRTATTSYQALWEDAGTWMLQHRCKICPDAIGMAADLVAFDCWPGGGPSGEDAGFNAVMTRTPAGDALLDDAASAGALVLDRDLEATDFECFQPHQSRKRRAIWARLAGQRSTGLTAPESRALAVAALAREAPFARNLSEARGTARRIRAGRGPEPIPKARDD